MSIMKEINVVSFIHPRFMALFRGVQYVHWVMHKCIMVKVGGTKSTRKVCKKQVNLPKTGGKFVKVEGARIIFAKQGGNVLKQRK